MTESRWSDDELLTATAAGNDTAFAEFYRRHLGHVLAFFLSNGRSPEVAADLAAETFAGALIACARYIPRNEPAAWLFGIARHKLHDSFRRRRVEDSARRQLALPRLLLDDADLERVDELASPYAPDVLTFLDELPEPQRQAVKARIVDEREYEDIAVELECSEQVVRQRVSRGLEALRNRVEGSSG